MPAQRMLGLVAVLSLAVGCGSKTASPPGVAHVTTSSATTTLSRNGGEVTRQSKADSLVAFSACMRKNGVANFPDPVAVNGGMRLTIGPGHGTDPNLPQFKAAQKTCEKLLPGGGKLGNSTPSGADQAKLLQFAACMRSHGLPDFPDPQVSSGNVKIEGGKAGGLDPSAPVFQAAQKACKHLLPGGGPAVAP